MQAAEFLVHVGQAGGEARQAAIALIGGVGDVDGIGDGAQERLEAGFGLALLAELVERLFGLDDLLFRLAGHFDPAGLVGDVTAKRHEFAADREIVDHLGVVAGGEGGDRSARQTGQIGRPAKFLQSLVILQKRLERDRRGQRVFRDPRLCDLVDPCMDRLVEMLRIDDRRDPVVDVVVGQDRAEELLLGLDIVGQCVVVLRSRLIGANCPDFGHFLSCFVPGRGLTCLSPSPSKCMFLWISCGFLLTPISGTFCGLRPLSINISMKTARQDLLHQRKLSELPCG